MRYTAKHKEETRARIIKAAGTLFRRNGYHASGVDKIMEAAGLTAGGFYAHFESKEALLAATLEPAAAEVEASHRRALARLSGRARALGLIERYLTPQHMKQCEHGCPLPALASEVARAEKPVKASFEAVVRGFVSRLVGDSEAALTEERALAIVALCVGGLSLARSVEDRALAERILATCQELAQLGLNDHSDSSKRSVAPNTATDENSRRMPI